MTPLPKRIRNGCYVKLKVLKVISPLTTS